MNLNFSQINENISDPNQNIQDTLLQSIAENLIQIEYKKIKTDSKPRNPTEIKQFLGLVAYNGKLIKDFSKVAKPLTKLSRAEVSLNLNKNKQMLLKN